MQMISNEELKRCIARQSRENGISYALFRNAIGKKMGLNSTDFNGLDLIFFRGTSTPSELSRYTGLSSGSTTAMIDRLERTGLIMRQNNPRDRRGTLVVLQPQAAQKFSPLFLPARLAQDKLLDNYSTPQLQLLLDYLQKSAAMYDELQQNA